MERIISYPEAIREAIEQEMDRDPSVFVMGQGVDDPKAILGTTKGLVDKFGPNRIFDTPLAEDGMTGVAVGAAMAGLRPIHTHIRMDFVMLAMNQLVNHLDKIALLSEGRYNPKVIIRTSVGGKKQLDPGLQHCGDYYHELKTMCKNIDVHYFNCADIIYF